MSDEKPKGPPSGDESTEEILVRDRRFWVQEGESKDVAKPPRKSPYPSFVEELQAKTRESEQKLEEAAAGLQKAREEGEALRRRLTRDFERRLAAAKGESLTGFLEVLDNFDLAIRAAEDSSNLEAFLQGIRMVQDLFLQSLRNFGLEPMDLLGKEFDPRVAEAMGMADVEDREREGRIVDVLRRGFTVKGEVLRAAQVRVGRHVPAVLPQASLVEDVAESAEEPPRLDEVPSGEAPGSEPESADSESGPNESPPDMATPSPSPDPEGSEKDPPVSPADVEF